MNADCEKWSTSYLKRRELMNSLEIPTLSETKEELGQVLAGIVFSQCHEQLKEDLGLARPLEGAGNELWVSPSDLLIGKVRLKPPLTQKHIQALTHQGILKIGATIERKYWNEMEIEKARALQEQEDMLRRLFELQKAKLAEAIKAEEREKYLEQLYELRGYYENYIDTLVDSMNEEMRLQEERLNAETDALNDSWDQKLKDEVEKTVIKITTEFLRKIQEQEDILVDIFQRKIQDVETKRKCEVEFEKTKCIEALIQVKHCLECKNITNLMYLLCKERRKCKDQKVAIETEYEREVRGLQRMLRNKTDKVALLTRIKERKTKQVNVRERCLLEILKQFQKFIYFALRASPTQAEFLLDLDKMMTIEISNYCLEPEKPKKSSITSKIPPIQNEPPSLEIMKEEIYKSRKTSDDVQLYDEEYGEDSDVLPAFYLNKKMYVREDFRDMFSRGVEIDRHHPLWNKDVEELMNVFREAVQKERRNDSFTISSKRSHLSQHSTVHFTQFAKSPPHSTSSLVHSVSIMAEKSSWTPPGKHPSISNDSDSVEIRPPPTNFRNSRKSIVQASDSLELLKENLKLSRTGLHHGHGSDDVSSLKVCVSHKGASLKHDDFSSWDAPMAAHPSQEGASHKSTTLMAKDSLILRMASIERNLTETTKSKSLEKIRTVSSTLSLESSKKTPNETFSLTKSSKLVLHCDSLEILRSATKLSASNLTKHMKGEDELEQSSKTSVVKFSTNPAVRVSIPSTSKRNISSSGYKKSRYKRIPIHKAHVVGNRKMKAHLQTPKEFTAERIRSLVNILKADQSLMRLFTSVSLKCS